jgi:hypothetical protein
MEAASLSVAYVSALLKSLLENGLVGDPTAALVGDITCSLLAPDRIETGSTEQARLNLFLHQVQANTSLRGRSALGEDGQLRGHAEAPLVLDLYYLLTAYGSRELQPELLIGYATQQFHRAAELTFRSGFWVGVGQQGRPGLSIRAPSFIAESPIQRIVVRPHFLGGEELSKIWSALQARYRPSVAYRVAVELQRDEHEQALQGLGHERTARDN